MSQIDEQLRTELQRQGVWVTSMRDLYNLGTRKLDLAAAVPDWPVAPLK